MKLGRVANMVTQLGWDLLEHRRAKHRITMLHKILQGACLCLHQTAVLRHVDSPETLTSTTIHRKYGVKNWFKGDKNALI